MARIGRYLRRHPVLCLLLMSPGFPEYISGSSSFTALLFDPAWFFLALGINVGMYTVGALVIREVAIRWNKGWPTIFALGGAYAIMEEGIADQTIFNPTTSPIGTAGTYGHFMGINWLWFPDVFVIHILMSISIPLLLLGYALPETRGRRLVSDRALVPLVGVLALDTVLLTVIVVASRHYWYGFPMLGATVVGIVALCLLGFKLPRFLLPVRRGPPTASRLTFYLVGCFAYPLMVMIALLGAGSHLPPALVVLGIVTEVGGLAGWSIRNIGDERNERHLIAFSVGLLTIGFLLGLATEFPFELVAVADAAALYFFLWLDRSFRRPGEPSVLHTPASPQHGSAEYGVFDPR